MTKLNKDLINHVTTGYHRLLDGGSRSAYSALYWLLVHNGHRPAGRQPDGLIRQTEAEIVAEVYLLTEKAKGVYLRRGTPTARRWLQRWQDVLAYAERWAATLPSSATPLPAEVPAARRPEPHLP